MVPGYTSTSISLIRCVSLSTAHNFKPIPEFQFNFSDMTSSGIRQSFTVPIPILHLLFYPMEQSSWSSSFELRCDYPELIFHFCTTQLQAVNAGYCSGSLETIGLAYSDNGWNGTWRMLTPDTILHNPDGSPHR